MTTAKDLALSVSLASYAKDHSAPAVVTISNQKLVKLERPKTAKVKAIKAAKPSAAEPTAKPVAPSPNGAMVGLKLPAAGTLGAKGFIMMMNRAKSRDEKIVAIASFVGYDPAADFGTQEMAATAKAKAEISPVKVTAPTPSASRSAAGFVAGMPNNQRKVILDLLGRENLAVSTRNENVRESRNRTLSWAERKLAIGLARLEQERLACIRAELAQYL